MGPAAKLHLMESVIIVKGASGRGKTRTLRLLIDFLISEYESAIVYGDGRNSDIKKDCFVILNVPQYGKVGVITYGDHGCEKDINAALNKCLESDCKAVVGASHTQYYRPYDTAYSILWDFADKHKAKAVETTTLIKYDNWGAAIDEAHLNSICARNIVYLLLNL